MYRIYYQDTPVGRQIAVSNIEGSQEIFIYSLYLGTDGSFGIKGHVENQKLAEHLRVAGTTSEFRDIAGTLGERVVYWFFNKSLNRATDFGTFEEEQRFMESGPLSEPDAFLIHVEFKDSLVEPRRILDEEFTYAEEMASKGEYRKARESIGRIKSSLLMYGKGDIIGYLSKDVKGNVYSPFDGLGDESHRELVNYVSAKMAELKRRLEATALVT